MAHGFDVDSYLCHHMRSPIQLGPEYHKLLLQTLLLQTREMSLSKVRFL